VGDRDAFGEPGGAGGEDYVAGNGVFGVFGANWGRKSGNLSDFG
jgi:hypothetical protein